MVSQVPDTGDVAIVLKIHVLFRVDYGTILKNKLSVQLLSFLGTYGYAL